MNAKGVNLRAECGNEMEIQMKVFRWASVVASLLAVTSGAALAAANSANPLVEKVRSANDRFKDVSVAKAEGYAPIACASGVDTLSVKNISRTMLSISHIRKP
jgi:hypothetical protein